MATATLQHSFADIFDNTYREKEPVVYREDPLVLACALKYLLDINPQIYYSLDSDVVQDHVTDGMRDYAEQIRKYYTKKFFWQSLTDHQRLSPFRSRMIYLLEHREKTCKDKDHGIYYKLPWFYEEDMIYDEFKSKYTTTDVPSVIYAAPAVKSTFEITYLKSTLSRQQKRKLERFWFTDGTYLYNIEVLEDNPLIEMFRNMIVPGRAVKVQAFKYQDRIDKMQYYKLVKFNFVKENNA